MPPSHHLHSSFLSVLSTERGGDRVQGTLEKQGGATLMLEPALTSPSLPISLPSLQSQCSEQSLEGAPVARSLRGAQGTVLGVCVRVRVCACVCAHVCDSFIGIQFTQHTIHPFTVHNSVVFVIFTYIQLYISIRVFVSL